MGSRLLRLTTLVALLAALGARRVRDDDDDGEGASTQATEEQPTATEASPADAQAALKDTSVKPVIPKPTGSPPRKLETEDIVKGKGPAAKPGDNVTVHYAGVTFSTGEEFDASWDLRPALQLPARRRPGDPGLGQGPRGNAARAAGASSRSRPSSPTARRATPPAIGPNETLVFVIDMLEIQ